MKVLVSMYEVTEINRFCFKMNKIELDNLHIV